MHLGRTQPLRLRRLDRLSALTVSSLALLSVLGTACSGGSKEEPTLSRVAAVKATKTEVAPEKWCDVSYGEAEAPKLELPEAVPARAGGPAATLPADRWVWLNLWATWCGPCRKEMPLLVQWRDQLKKEGIDVDLWFLSLDEQGETLTRFLNQNPEMAPGNSLRMVSQSALEPWLKKYRLDATAAIPIQVLASPGGKVRCIRVGSLHDGDFRTIKALLK